MNLSNIRSEIDTIDDKIITLLSERFALVNEVAKAKIETSYKVRDDAREREILDKISSLSPVYGNEITGIFKEMFEQSRKRQTKLIIENAKIKNGNVKAIKVINGVNLNMLGVREPSLYGNRNYCDLENYISQISEKFGCITNVVQYNSESDIVEDIQKSIGIYDGIVINPGAYTHTSIAILDALKAVDIPVVEVHLTNVEEREEYRRISYISEVAIARYIGLGFDGYGKAIEYLANRNAEPNNR